MDIEEIRKLLIGHHKNTNSLKYCEEVEAIRKSFLDKLRNDFNDIWEQEDKYIGEERKLVDSIISFVNCEDFLIILGCNNYLIRIKSVFENCKLNVGRSKMQLEKIDKSLQDIKKSYEYEFDSFCQNASNCMNRDIKKVDLETKMEINEIYKERIISKTLFNELKNACLL